jgi:hypothetical protein
MPKRKYPFVIAGFIRRWERNHDDGGGEVVDSKTSFVVWKDRSKEKLGPSEMQKFSPFGFILTWPLCFVAWIQIKKQTPSIPNSEIVPFWRFGLWRWDPGDSTGKIWVGPWTWYGPGLHWD